MTVSELKKLKSGSDIRGVAVEGDSPLTLTDEAVTLITKAFVKWLSLKRGKVRLKVAVGHDSRISAPRLEKLVADALLACGADVVLTGLSSTPSMFILLKQSDFGCDASVMLTASHMPYDKNGLKFFTEESGLDGKQIDEILEIAASGDFPSGSGKCERKSFMDEYSQILVNLVEKECGKLPLLNKKIVVDAGNGAGGFFAEKVLKPLGADTEGSQFLNPDGMFPNHIPNPEDKKAIESLKAAVAKNNAELGIIFDTDVDRAACVGEDGEEINRNSLIALVSAMLLSEKAGVIVTDSVTSDGLTEFIEKLGGRHLRFKRGYRNVIDKCRELNESGTYSPLAIETSGHAAFAENYYLDDGAYLITQILISLSKQAAKGKTLVSLISSLTRPAEADEIRLGFTDESKDFKAEGAKIIDDLKTAANERADIAPATDNYEGVRMSFKKEDGGGWILVRMSVHDPVVPINIESDALGGNLKKAKKLLNLLEAYSFLNVENLKNYITDKEKL